MVAFSIMRIQVSHQAGQSLVSWLPGFPHPPVTAVLTVSNLFPSCPNSLKGDNNTQMAGDNDDLSGYYRRGTLALADVLGFQL